VLIGVDHAKFYEANPQFEGMTEAQIDDHFNHEFDTELEPNTAQWNGFETTFYVNPGATDITAIHPYAAYNVSADEWTVPPVEIPEDWDPRSYFPAEWWQHVDTDIVNARGIIDRYKQLASSVRMLPNGAPQQLSKLAQARRELERAAALFADIHQGRRLAFSKTGLGYFDYNNLRWQAHKQAGTANELHDLAALNSASRKAAQTALYGEPLVGPHDSLARASSATASWYRRHLGGS
jgi:hypothetical protein